MQSTPHSDSQLSLLSLASGSMRYTPSLSVSQRRMSNASSSRTMTAATGKRPRLTSKKSSARTTAARLKALANLQASASPAHVNLMELQPAEEGSIEALFIQYGVKDVKHVEDRALSEAGGKREELRTMVGARYRDLLGAADSIVRMRRSSQALLGDLGAVLRDCSKSSMLAKAEPPTPRTNGKHTAADPSLGSPYALGTLIKLLLDTPENIWRAIEAEDYLSAARLEALGRVVYSELEDARARADEEDGASAEELYAAFPLVEKQWEGLRQLGVQVAKRAKASLQHPFATSFEAAQALAAVLLLEDTAGAGLMDLFWTQRTATLEGIAADASSSQIADVISSATKLLRLALATLKEAQDVWTASPEHEDLLSLVLKQIQTGSAEPNDDALRLRPILASLPNSHIFLRYLPPSVVAFTPFIDAEALQPPSQAAFDGAQRAWLDVAAETYAASLKRMCETLTEAHQLVAVREALDAVLHQAPSSATGRLQALTQDALLDRFNVIAEGAFDRLLEAGEAALGSALDRLPGSSADLQPASSLFSSTLDTTPRASSSKAVVSESGIQRLDARSPLLTECLACLEQGATSLRADLLLWTGTQAQAGSTDPVLIFSYHLERFCERMRDVLLRVVDEAKGDADRLTFLARYIQHGVGECGFFDVLVLAPSVLGLITDAKEAWRRLQQSAFDSLVSSLVAAAIEQLQKELEPFLAGHILLDTTSWPSKSTPAHPSPSLSHSFSLLIRRLDNLTLAFPDGVDALSQQLFASFHERYLGLAAAWSSVDSPRLQVQLQWDARLLAAMDGQAGDDATLQDYLCRSQQFLSPLLRYPLVLDEGEKARQANAQMAAPSKLISRFGLLPVPALR